MSRRRAFTLVELMMVVAIIGALAGIVFAVLGPSRERARETVCTSNLHQIGRAYAMYAADYDGAEPVVGVRARYYDLGFPSDEGDFYLFSAYLRSRAVLFCPSYHGRRLVERLATSYTGYSRDGERWADMVARRGPELPHMRCDWHNPQPNPYEALRAAPRWEVFRFNILRIGGSVRMVKRHGQDFDTWEW